MNSLNRAIGTFVASRSIVFEKKLFTMYYPRIVDEFTSFHMGIMILDAFFPYTIRTQAGAWSICVFISFYVLDFNPQ